MYSQIKAQLRQVIAYSQNIPEKDLDVDAFIDQWADAKKDIIKAFGNQLIYEVPTDVHFHLDEKARGKNLGEFVNTISSVYHNDALAEFITSNSDGFYDNVVSKTYEKDDIKVPCGMKLVKAFKFFEKDENLLEKFQIQASQIIQEDRVVGKLCFSVHPLDFMTVSVNTYNWRSCHALDGEFRAGNLSYMLDKSTIVCYIKGADDVCLPMFPDAVRWNSKKWRVLLYLSERWDMIFASKQYPFTSVGGLDVVKGHFMRAIGLKETEFSDWQNDYVSCINRKNGSNYTLHHPYIPIYGKLHEMGSIVTNGEKSLQFNDLLSSSTYTEPYFTIKDNCFWWEIPETVPKFVIGHKVPCLCCEDGVLLDPDMMACRRCAEHYGLYSNDDGYTCDCCGGYFTDSDWFEFCGEIFCPECYENETFECDNCHGIFFNAERNYDRETETYMCRVCYEERQECEE